MPEKRFVNKGKDIFQHGEWWCSTNGEHCADVIATAMNEIMKENEQLKTDYETLEIQDGARKQYQKELMEENEVLKIQLKSLERRCVLLHMRSMFSTVKSFKGDVSKRYKYSEKTDTIYDTANHYGQYDKVLGKKEIVMLLNEYETVLRGLEE